MKVRGSGVRGGAAGFMRPLLLIECNIGSGGGDQCVAMLPNAPDVNVEELHSRNHSHYVLVCHL